MADEEEEEQFMLRRYCPTEQRNEPVGYFKRGAQSCYEISVPQPPGPYIYQVYPSDPKRCLYRPLPPGQKWFLLARSADSTTELARIDSHDQYAYFGLPASTASIKWVRAATLAEALTK